MNNRLRKARLLIVATSLITASRVHAQSAEAEALFADGDRLMSAGKVAQACDAFEASNRIESRAGTLIRLGECRETNHQLASAWSAYKDALTRVRDPRKRDIAAAKVAELEPRLSYLTVLVSDESRVDGLTLTRNSQPLDPGLWNRAVPVNGGEYVIGGRAPGHEEWKTTVVVPAEAGKVSVEVPKFKELAKLVAPTAVTSDVASEEDDQSQPAPAGPWTMRREIAVGVGGGSVLALAAGVVLGLTAKAHQKDAHELCPDAGSCNDADRATDLVHSGHQLAIGANIAFGLAAGAGIAAGVLWFTGAPESRSVAIAPHVEPQGAGVALVGRF